MIEEDVIQFLVNETAAGTRVYTGARLNNTALPALVVRCNLAEQAALGSKQTALHRYEVDVLAIATTMVEAQSVAEDVASAMLAGCSNAIHCGGVAQTNHGILDEPDIADGDEQNYAVCTTSYTVYHYNA
jgi:hypothetical protein